MGQQQLLLIVLGIIIVGVAVVAAITLFRQHAINSKRNLVMNETITLASEAISYYKKPKIIAGGGNSFEGWDIPLQVKETATGSFRATSFKDSVVIIGIGSEVVNGSDSVEVRTVAYSDGYRTEIIH